MNIKWSVTFMLTLILSVACWGQAPKAPTKEQIQLIFNNDYGQRLLFFKPFEFPIELERTHKAMVKSLDKWVKVGLVTKNKSRFLAEKIMYGEPRMVSVGGFKYDVNSENMWVSDQGFFLWTPQFTKST